MRTVRTGLRESLVGKGVREDFLEEVLFEPGLGGGMGAAGRQDKGKEKPSEGLQKPPGEPQAEDHCPATGAAIGSPAMGVYRAVLPFSVCLPLCALPRARTRSTPVTRVALATRLPLPLGRFSGSIYLTAHGPLETGHWRFLGL